jgi:hypothetical protein
LAKHRGYFVSILLTQFIHQTFASFRSRDDASGCEPKVRRLFPAWARVLSANRGDCAAATAVAADQKVGFQVPTVIPLQRQWTTTTAQFLTSKRVPSCTRSRPGRTGGRNKPTVRKGSNHTGNSTAVVPVHCRRQRQLRPPRPLRQETTSGCSGCPGWP